MVESTSSLPKLEIQHVYGIRSSTDCQNNLKYNADGQLVYIAAALGIIHDVDSNTQKFIGGKQTPMVPKTEGDQLSHHRDDILCLAMTNDRTKVATGEIGPKPSVIIWDAKTGERIVSFQLQQDARGVSAVSFSLCGRYIACSDLSDHHRISIYNVERKVELYTQTGSSYPELEIAWSKRPDDLRFATVAMKEIKFWHPADVTKKLQVKGTFKQGHSTLLKCVAFDEEGWCYTGGENSLIQVWGIENTSVKTIKAHSQAVTALFTQGNRLISTSLDQKVAIMSIAPGCVIKLEKLIDLQPITSATNLPNGFAKSVDFYNGNLLLALRNGTILELKNAEAGDQDAKIIVQSHFEGDVYGLALTDDNQVLTCGEDNRIMMFDSESRQFVRGGKLSDKKMKDEQKKSLKSSTSQFKANKWAETISVSNKHQHVVVCNALGKVSVRAFDNFDKKICSLKQAKQYCCVAKYSPCQNFLATGSHDSHMRIYEINPETHEYNLIASDNRYHSWVNCLDWSTDSNTIRTSTGDYEVLYYNVTEKKPYHTFTRKATLKAGDSEQPDEQPEKEHQDQLPDEIEWASNTIHCGKDRVGIYPRGQGTNKSHVNTVEGSSDNSLLFTGDDFGLVNVFHFPNPSSDVSRSYSAHSEHVTRVVLSKDNQTLFTVGGQDKLLIQWKVIKE